MGFASATEVSWVSEVALARAAEAGWAVGVGWGRAAEAVSGMTEVA